MWYPTAVYSASQGILTVPYVYPYPAILPSSAPQASLSSNPDLTGNDANKVLIAAAGGITAIVAAMQAHPKHADVNHYACWALAVIAGNDVDVVRTLSLPASTALSLALFLHYLPPSSGLCLAPAPCLFIYPKHHLFFVPTPELDPNAKF